MADFFYIDLLLNEEEKMVKKMVNEFVEKEITPIINEYYEQGKFPLQLVKKMADLGLFGANIEGYECAGMNNVAYGLIMQELERGDSAIRSFVSVQSGLVMYPILEFGSEEQKNYYLPKLAKGELIGCFGLTEQDYGSNPGGLITTARKEGNQYIINGEKMWITNGTIADIAIIWAKDNDGIINGFIIEKGMKGFASREIKKKLSLKASDTAELIFEDCKVPEENRLPKAYGLKPALMCLTQARYGIAWGAIGAALACYNEALKYSKIRIQFDKPIAAFQLVQNKLVYMLTEIIKGQLLCIQLGRLKDMKLANHVHISMAKRNNVEIALKIARIARDILGASGITLEYSAMRHMCNLESVYTYEGTHDIHTLIIGSNITGIESYK